jgi:hypothetical protein
LRVLRASPPWHPPCTHAGIKGATTMIELLISLVLTALVALAIVVNLSLDAA